jgi:hypothetical protein
MDTADPKSLFLLLVTLAIIYFIPLTWIDDYSLWKMLVAATLFYIFYFCIGYLLPAIARYYSDTNQA